MRMRTPRRRPTGTPARLTETPAPKRRKLTATPARPTATPARPTRGIRGYTQAQLNKIRQRQK